MKHLPGLDEALLEIYGELDRDRLMTLVVRYAQDHLNAQGSSVFLRDDITGRYVLRGTTGLLENEDMPAERVEYEPGEGLTGWIAKRGRALRIANVKDREELHSIADDLVWSKKYSEISAKPGLAYLGVPILSRDGQRVIGVLRVSGKTEGQHFDAQDEALLSHVATLVSIAIENSQRYEREKRRARYFWLLLDIGTELDPRRPVKEMLQAVVDRVSEGFRTECCQIFLRADDSADRAVLRAAHGLPQSLIGDLTYDVGQGLTGHIIAQGTPVQIREPVTKADWGDPHISKIASHLPSGVYRSFIGVPLKLGDEVLGTLELINKIPSSPGHRDWFTHDDEGYLRLLSTSISGVLEGARYLKALNDVGVTAMRMQRIASFGTLAQRIRHEAANPLTIARLAANNLRGDLQKIATHSAEEEIQGEGPAIAPLEKRLDVIENNLDKVSEKLLDLLKFSQRIGFIRTTTNWNDVVREVLIWMAANRQQRGVDVHTAYEDLPPLFIEPNELFGVLVTVLRAAMESLDDQGGVIEIKTSLSADDRYVCTGVYVPEAPLSEKIACILDPVAGSTEELSPLCFEWALAEETVKSQYGGGLTWEASDSKVSFLLELPLQDTT